MSAKRTYASKPTRDGGQPRNPAAAVKPGPGAAAKDTRFATAQILQWDLENLGLATDALEAVADVLEYVGARGQDGGEDGGHAAWTAVGLGAAVRIVKNQIAGFCDLARRAPEVRPPHSGEGGER